MAIVMDDPSANLVAMTIRLEPVVGDALKRAAEREGQEVADYAARVLIEHVLPLIEQSNPPSARRLQAEIEVKARAIALAKQLSPEQAFDPNVTLKVFQAIREEDELRQLYIRAIGDRPSDERGNPIKARVNRTLGAAIKTAVRAMPKTIDGNPMKVQVSNEFIFSYTQLEPPPGAKLARV
jgi:hypothetical protein